MSEKFKAEKYFLLDEQPAGQGMEAEVSFLKIKRGERIINLVRKTPMKDGIFEEDKLLERFRNSVKIYKTLKKKNFPVPKTWRIDDETGDLYVSDLSDGGEKEILDSRDFQKIMRLKKKPSVVISKDMSDELSDKLRETSQMASAENIVIPLDAWFLVVDKNGKKAEIILGDISGIVDMTGESIDANVIKKYNINSVETFIREMSFLVKE